MIEIVNATKRYGSVTVLGGVNATIDQGGVVALIGPNGAGKSTLLCAIGRLLEIEEGTVSVDGMNVATSKSADIARSLAILRQDNHLPVRLSVRELVEFGRFPRSGTNLGEEDHHKVDWALESLELTELAGRRLDELSGGQRQRAFIAMVLCQETDYILLDEPLNNLDVRHAMQTMSLVRSLADDHGKTVIIVLHDINIAVGYCDRIIALADGLVVADGTPLEVVTQATVRNIYGIDIPIRMVDGQPVVMSFSPLGSEQIVAENWAEERAELADSHPGDP